MEEASLTLYSDPACVLEPEMVLNSVSGLNEPTISSTIEINSTYAGLQTDISVLILSKKNFKIQKKLV